MSKQIITELEKQTGFVAINRADVPDTDDREEFIAVAINNLSKFTHVNYADRIKFLNDNNYELSFENLIDADLHARNNTPSVK